MRELKFRFYDHKISKMMVYQEPNEAKDVIFDKWETTPKCSPLMQYTGLKDKNGKEIYEGDLLKNKELWEVRYVPTLARFMMINYHLKRFDLTELNMSALALIDFEVIGNVYEMPDWDF